MPGWTCYRCEERRQNQYLVYVTQENVERQRRKKYWSSGSERTRDPGQVVRHTGEQPWQALSTQCSFDNIDVHWCKWLERETHKFPFSPGNECHCLHFWSSKNSVCGIVLYAEKLNNQWAQQSAEGVQVRRTDLHCPLCGCCLWFCSCSLTALFAVLPLASWSDIVHKRSTCPPRSSLSPASHHSSFPSRSSLHLACDIVSLPCWSFSSCSCPRVPEPKRILVRSEGLGTWTRGSGRCRWCCWRCLWNSFVVSVFTACV